MKKAVASLAILVIMALAFTSSTFAASPGKIIEAPDLKILVDGKTVVCKDVPIILGDSTLLPLRELAVMLGVQNDDQHIIYEPSNKSVTILKDNTKIVVYIGKFNAFVNDEPRTLDVIPVIYKHDIAYIPFKFVAEALGKKVIWDGPSKTILLCDATKFKNVKGIMDKVAAEFKSVSKYKSDISISLDMKSGMISTKMGINANAEVDKTGKKMHMLMDMDMLGMKIATESYYADYASYTRDPYDGTWKKKVMLQPEYDKAFASESSILLKSDDTFCARLDQVDSTNADEIRLKGELIDNTLYESFLSQQDLGGDQSIIDSNAFDSFKVEITIDKNTYLVNGIVLTMESKYSEDDVKTAISMTAEAEYSDYNGAFEVAVPGDVVNNAVETKLPTQLK